MKSVIRIAAVSALACLFGCAHDQTPAPKATEAFDLDEERETVAPRACTSALTESAASDGRIATDHLLGSVVTYPVGDPSAPRVTATGGGLHVTAHAPVTEKAQYVGVMVPFPKCTDASAFTGVRFSLRGSYKGCSLQYATNDGEHQDRNTAAAYATGGRGAYPPQTQFTSSQITSVAQTVSVPFSGQEDIRGNPPLPLDKSKLTGVLWQFTVSPAGNIEDGTTACVADIDIDDVKFY